MSQGSKSIYHFDYCGEINTEKVIELAKERAEELNLKNVVIASEPGTSALKVMQGLKGFDYRGDLCSGH